MGAVKESSIEKFVAEVPRFFMSADALNRDEFKAYLVDELTQLVDSDFVRIEKIAGKTMPTAEEAMKSKSRDMLTQLRQIHTVAGNITKATGGVAFLGIKDGDVLFNRDVCNLFGTDFVGGSLIDSMQFFSLGKGLLDSIADLTDKKVSNM